MTTTTGPASVTAEQLDPRAEYIAGLRALADLLEEHGDWPLPTDGSSSPFDWWVWDHNAGDSRSVFAAIVRALPGTKTKTVGEGYAATWFTVTAQLRGLTIDVNANRATVCTRVVKGVREVTEEVPDPDALAAVPTITVTREVEDVEWECAPILAGRDGGAA